MRSSIKHNFELQTRGLTKVDAEISLQIDGREIPAMSVMGTALEKAVIQIQEAIKESYEKVPERV